MGYQDIETTRPKARKGHRCIWCGEQIAIGEKYVARAYRFEGYFCRDALHLECEDAMMQADQRDIEDGFPEYHFKRGQIIDKDGEDWG